MKIFSIILSRFIFTFIDFIDELNKSLGILSFLSVGGTVILKSNEIYIMDSQLRE